MKVKYGHCDNKPEGRPGDGDRRRGRLEQPRVEHTLEAGGRGRFTWLRDKHRGMCPVRATQSLTVGDNLRQSSLYRHCSIAHSGVSARSRAGPGRMAKADETGSFVIA